MKITDPKMMERMNKALTLGGALFSLDDILEYLRDGRMQGHVEGDTWAITQIHDWPRKKSVNILYVVGNIKDSIKLEKKITGWAKDIGADTLTAIGREGWWEHRLPGWKKVGTLYSKEL
jgi:hypothetical protein